MSDPGTVRALNCSQCGGPLTLRAAGASTTLVCLHCGSTLDATDPDFPLIEKAAQALRRPEIPLGSRGTLDGIDWEAIGYLERESDDGGWSEYLLFNPYHGYRFLIDDGDRFSLGMLLDRFPEVMGGSANDSARAYREAGGPYWARVTFAVGEFYWRVTVGETVQVEDYALTEVMLSRESSDNEVTWTHSRMLKRGVAEAAFGLSPRSPGYGTPSPHEPSPYWRWFWISMAMTGIALVALIFASATLDTRREVLLAHDIPVQMDGQDRTTTLGPVTVARQTAIAITSSPSTLDNAWIDIDYSLVDRKTQESYDVSATSEEYHGQDSDGPWREGNASPETRIASVPAGTYDLVVTVGGHSWLGEGSYFATPPPTTEGSVRVTVEQGASFPGNYWTAILLLLIWPGILLLLHIQSEKARRAGWD